MESVQLVYHTLHAVGFCDIINDFSNLIDGYDTSQL